MIYFDKVSKVYADRSVALSAVTFAVEPGEFVSIVGHSGAGKTTLLKLVMVEERPTAGAVFFHSTNIHALDKRSISRFRRRLGSVFQDFRLLSVKTAYENIAFAMEAAGRSDEEIASDVPHVLDLVDLAGKTDNFPGELSGGERQRLAIARAIINQPDLLIADEPTGNLDPDNALAVFKIFQKINNLGTTVLLTTHNADLVNRLGRRVIVMENGCLVRDDKKGRYAL